MAGTAGRGRGPDDDRNAGRGDDRGAGRGDDHGAGRGDDHGAGRGDDRGAGRGDGHSADRPQAGSGGTPLLTVIRGDASAEEIAALVAVLAAKNAEAARLTPAAAASAPPSRWADRSVLLRRPLRHGPGAWRSSARPGF